MNLLGQLNNLLPLACTWVKTQEDIILQQGQSLSSQAAIDAKNAGVINMEKVKILMVPAIPVPENPLLKAACAETDFLTEKTAGLTMEYGIFIRSDYVNDRPLVVHELVHVAQYEKLGSIEAFLKQYLFELATIGYQNMPMEQESIHVTRSICG